MNKETVANWFEIINAEEALQQVELMRQSAAVKANYMKFIRGFRATPFVRFKKTKPDFTAPWNDTISKFYFIAAPFCFSWIKFDEQAPAEVQGKWFYFNLSSGIKPNANSKVKSAINSDGRRLVFCAYANSSNEELLNLPDAERGNKMPVFDQAPNDLVLVANDNPFAEDPVFGAPFSAFEIYDKASFDAEVKVEKWKPIFGNYSEMLAHISAIQYNTEMWETEQKWQISTIREKILWGQGVRPTNRYITLNRDNTQDG
jgi:hypothetical protein